MACSQLILLFDLADQYWTKIYFLLVDFFFRVFIMMVVIFILESVQDAIAEKELIGTEQKRSPVDSPDVPDHSTNLSFYMSVMIANHRSNSGTRLENRNASDSPDLTPTITDDQGYLRFRVFIVDQIWDGREAVKYPIVFGISDKWKPSFLELARPKIHCGLFTY